MTAQRAMLPRRARVRRWMKSIVQHLAVAAETAYLRGKLMKGEQSPAPIPTLLGESHVGEKGKMLYRYHARLVLCQSELVELTWLSLAKRSTGRSLGDKREMGRGGAGRGGGLTSVHGHPKICPLIVQLQHRCYSPSKVRFCSIAASCC